MFVMSILCSDLKFVLIFFILLYVFCLLLKRFMFLLLYICFVFKNNDGLKTNITF